MSDRVSALSGARGGAIAHVEEAGLIGMITLRGDFADKGFGAALKTAGGMALPAQRAITRAKGRALVWMSPDELLLVCDHGEAQSLTDALGAGFGDLHAIAVNVSDARAVFDITGRHARDVLAKLFPVDLSAAAFQPGQVRRSRMAQVPAALWMEDDTRFRVVCFRSVARYAFDVLCVAAQAGSEVRLNA